MAVSCKKRNTDRTANMTQMELAREERKQHEMRVRGRERAIEETNRRAAELFAKVCRVIVHRCPADTTGPCPDPYQIEHYEREVRRWCFECLAVIKLASVDMRTSCYAQKYNWNPDWREKGCLTMGRVLQQTDKPGPGETRVSDVKYVPLHKSDE